MLEKFKDPQYMFCAYIVALAFVLDLIAFFFTLKLEHDLIVMVLTTFNTGGFISAVNFVIGSSAGSKKKDEQIASLQGVKAP